jgi:homoserine dehydrogenase
MYRLALIGFGNVGQGLAQILRDRGDDLAERFGGPLRLVAVCDLLKGVVYAPEGLNPITLLEAVEQTGNLKGLPGVQKDWDALTTIRESDADVIVELSYTDLKTGEPARTHIEAALESGKHVVTTNKGPIALYYPQLAEKARANGVEIGAEGTVMSGTPALGLGLDYLAGAGVQKIQGILNGTTNYILTQMEAGASYSDALEEAQERGYAEADPTGDVEGHDAAGKVVILANLLMGAALTMNDVDCTGITSLTLADIQQAQAAGERWKLIGTVEKSGDSVKASVRPTRIPAAHPLASVGGATNAITFTTDLLGEVTLIGPGAGRIETGYALIVDLLAIHRKSGKKRT